MAISAGERKKKKLIYPNHHTMKKNRLVKLERVGSLCEICGAIAKEIHHIDKSITNHDIENLRVLCHSCHMKLHGAGRPRKRISFNGKKYSLWDLMEYSGISRHIIYAFLKKPNSITVGSFMKIIKAMRILNAEAS